MSSHNLPSVTQSLFRVQLSRWIMYLMGGIDRYIGYSANTRSSTGRYIGRVSVKYRSSIGRVSVEYRPMYRPILLSVDILGGSPILDQYFTDTLPILHRYFTDISPMLHRYFTSVDTRPTRDRQVNALVSVDISTDRLVDTSVDSIQYRSTVSSMGRYVGRQYRSIYRQIVSSIGRYIGRYIKQYIDRYFGRQTDVSVDMYRFIQFGEYTPTPYKDDSISLNLPTCRYSSAHQGYLTEYRSFMENENARNPNGPQQLINAVVDGSRF